MTQQEHRRERFAAQTTESVTRGEATNINGYMRRDLHAPAITKQRSAGCFARWVYRHHRQTPPSLRRQSNQARDERAFAHARRTGDADNMGWSRERSQFVE